MISTPVILELESPILESHIPLWGNEYGLEFQLLDLDPIPDPILTPESLLDLSHLPKSVLVPILPESKSIILSFHTPFWDKAVDKFDSEISYGIWKLDGVKIFHGFIILMGYIKNISGGFL